MDDETYVYIDGEIVESGKAQISVYDHALLYGGAIFEGIGVYDDRIFRLDDHLERLYQSAKLLKLDVPLERTELREAIVDTLKANSGTVDYVRPIVSRGTGPLGLGNLQRTEPKVLILVAKDSPSFSESQGVKATTVSTRRTPFEAVEGRIKATNYLNNILAQLEVLESDADYGIMLDCDGYIAEACTHNVFCVIDGTLKTPTVEHSLDGITRKVVLEVAEENHIATVETKLTRYDLTIADELLLTNTMDGVGWVSEYDGQQIGDGQKGPVTDVILEGFRDCTDKQGYQWK